MIGKWSLIGASVLLATAVTAAQPESDGIEAEQQQRAVERGSLAWRSPSLARQPGFIRTVEREELERTGVLDLGEALRRVPTVPQIHH